NDGTLLDTLEGYFHCNGNLSETARIMHLHRNPLLYRLGRIEEILGQSLDDPELRLSLEIAMKIRHLLPYIFFCLCDLIAGRFAHVPFVVIVEALHFLPKSAPEGGATYALYA